eukprot:g81274.t1
MGSSGRSGSSGNKSVPVYADGADQTGQGTAELSGSCVQEQQEQQQGARQTMPLRPSSKSRSNAKAAEAPSQQDKDSGKKQEQQQQQEQQQELGRRKRSALLNNNPFIQADTSIRLRSDPLTGTKPGDYQQPKPLRQKSKKQRHNDQASDQHNVPPAAQNEHNHQLNSSRGPSGNVKARVRAYVQARAASRAGRWGKLPKIREGEEPPALEEESAGTVRWKRPKGQQNQAADAATPAEPVTDPVARVAAALARVAASPAARKQATSLQMAAEPTIGLETEQPQPSSEEEAQQASLAGKLQAEEQEQPASMEEQLEEEPQPTSMSCLQTTASTSAQSTSTGLELTQPGLELTPEGHTPGSSSSTDLAPRPTSRGSELQAAREKAITFSALKKVQAAARQQIPVQEMSLPQAWVRTASGKKSVKTLVVVGDTATECDLRLRRSRNSPIQQVAVEQLSTTSEQLNTSSDQQPVKAAAVPSLLLSEQKAAQPVAWTGLSTRGETDEPEQVANNNSQRRESCEQVPVLELTDAVCSEQVDELRQAAENIAAKMSQQVGKLAEQESEMAGPQLNETTEGNCKAVEQEQKEGQEQEEGEDPYLQLLKTVERPNRQRRLRLRSSKRQDALEKDQALRKEQEKIRKEQERRELLKLGKAALREASSRRDSRRSRSKRRTGSKLRDVREDSESSERTKQLRSESNKLRESYKKREQESLKRREAQLEEQEEKKVQMKLDHFMEKYRTKATHRTGGAMSVNDTVLVVDATLDMSVDSQPENNELNNWIGPANYVDLSDVGNTTMEWLQEERALMRQEEEENKAKALKALQKNSLWDLDKTLPETVQRLTLRESLTRSARAGRPVLQLQPATWKNIMFVLSGPVSAAFFSDCADGYTTPPRSSRHAFKKSDQSKRSGLAQLPMFSETMAAAPPIF